MPVITLPDGTHCTFDEPVTVMQVARSIGTGLAKATLAGKVDGHMVDASYVVNHDAAVTLLTANDPEGLEVLRHSCAHVLAQAVKRLYPSAQVTIGPVVEDGFYYDFATEKPFSEDDLKHIEQTMNEIIKEDLPVSYCRKDHAAAIAYFERMGEYYKADIIRDIPGDEVLTLYTQGEFTDLCRGPHIPSTGKIKAFKLMRVTGAYWRGDAGNEMLQRIYGTCWPDKKSLKAYLHRLEEAERRDHRKLGKALKLFHFEETSPGMAFWHPRGVAIWRVVEDYMRDSNERYGCSEIRTPLMADVSMWEQSGHKDKFGDHMFMTHSENRQYAIRPMNCPTCIQLYNEGLHSWRDLPLRRAEFGIVHRNEASGALHGLLRVRSFTQDDGHIFCTSNQIGAEVAQMVSQCYETYYDFGFEDIEVKLALRPEKRIGSDTVWDNAEATLDQVLCDKGVHFDYLPGEGAFYGPKIEFHLRDAIGRTWQCGTIQLDFSMPERLGATYVDEHSQRQTPVMLHRAIVGSMERFIGMLIEHYAGKMPLWLAPVQAMVMGISNKQDDYVQTVQQKLVKSGLRATLDLRNEKIGFKIREHTLAKVPYFIIVGEQEQHNGTVSLRAMDGTDYGAMSLQACIGHLQGEIAQKGRQTTGGLNN